MKLRTTTDPDTGTQVPVTDADGGLVYDPDGAALADQPWLAWSVVKDTAGRVVNETTGPSAGFDDNPGVRDPGDITGYDTGRAVGYDRSYAYDSAGRLVTVTDHTADGHGADVDASACVVRSYAFDANSRRTSVTGVTHTDGDCAGTTNTTTAVVGSNFYDTADRATKGQGGLGAYTYDLFGRVTTLPGVDAPNPGGGDITLGYFDDDLPRTVTQGGTSTTFTLDSAGRRATATTTSAAGTTSLVRHYSDGSDNPAWVSATDVAGKVTTTRYGASIAGDLGVSIADDGTTSVAVANLHGDVLTNITIGGTAASSAAADGIDGWSDYTEYGAPRDTAATAVVAGAVGYGWLGAKQRATSSDTAGLTLMGDRLYNAVTGRFTALDPEPGGSATPYAYPTDPINQYDLNGHWWGWVKKAWRASGAAARWMTESRIGRAIHTGCSYAWGVLGTACGAVYAAAYARQGRWGAAAAEGVGMVVGGRVAHYTAKAYNRVRFTGNISRHTVRRIRRAVHYTAQAHGLFASHFVGDMYQAHRGRNFWRY